MECTPSSCANMGTCIQEWNSFRCDCDMTSFTGDTCAEGQYLRIHFSSSNLLELLPVNQKHIYIISARVDTPSENTELECSFSG